MKDIINVTLKELDPGEFGFDVEIDLVSNPTVQDYLNSMNIFQEKNIAGCDGCTNCCWERVPITYQDMVNYMALLGSGEENKNSYNDGKPRPVFKKVTSKKEFIENYCDVIERDGAIDIILKRRKDGSCIFLDKDNNRCGAWSARGFICQSYICLPSSKNARDLRSAIVNGGEDMLIADLGLDSNLNVPVKPCSYKEFYIKDILNK